VRLFLSGVLFWNWKLFWLIHWVVSLMEKAGFGSFAMSISREAESLQPAELEAMSFTVNVPSLV